jgi:hypothetical protein
MHRRFAQRHASPRRARRLGVNGGDLVARIDNRPKRRYGEIGRAHEDNAHHQLLGVSNLGSGKQTALN